MWKDKGLQLVMLSTDNKAKFAEYTTPHEEDGKIKFQRGEYNLNSFYLYLLSDEEIKEGDWCCKKDVKGWVFKWVDTTNDWYDNSKKIIATTDPSLNLPCFPSSFLEEYVKRYNSKQPMEVEAKYRLNSDTGNNVTEWEELVLNRGNTISIRFKEEKMYSRGEVEELCGKAFYAGEAYRTGSCEGFKQIHPNKYEWIKENLK